jgi:hypothetical protein
MTAETKARKLYIYPEDGNTLASKRLPLWCTIKTLAIACRLYLLSLITLQIFRTD